MALGAFGLTTNDGASDLSVTVAGTVACTPVTALTGMQSATVSLDFRFGSGGETCKAYVQTSLDGGNTWIDIACMAAATANLKKVWNFSALTPVVAAPVVPTDGALADNTAIDGILGDRLRVKKVSTGVYGGSTLLVGRLVAH